MADEEQAAAEAAPPGVDPNVPSSPRIWGYWLGGKDNYEVDRQAGDAFVAMYPPIVDIARSSRAFLVRAVGFLAGEAGIGQFLDIGTGLPTSDNTHQVAQRVRPGARVVYIDNDPVVLAHARALLTSSPEGRTDYIDADLRDPGRVLSLAQGHLDFSRPIALILCNILGHIPGHDDARSIVRELLAALPVGSYLVSADGTNVIDPEKFGAAIDYWNSVGSLSYHLRSPEMLATYFEGLTLLDPGIVSCPRWRPNNGGIGAIVDVDEFCGVGRKDVSKPGDQA